MFNLVAGILLSYLVGAIPFALLLARTRGVDIRQVGSGNVGATNVFRSVDKRLGVLTFALDVLKGFVPAFFVARLFPFEHAGLIYGCAAILGHNFPVYLQFRGGKGVATSVGVLLGVAPAAAGIGILAWAILFATTRYVSLASIGAAAIIPASGWWLYRAEGVVLPVVLTILGGLVIIRHHSNIRRLLDGTEHQFKKPST